MPKLPEEVKEKIYNKTKCDDWPDGSYNVDSSEFRIAAGVKSAENKSKEKMAEGEESDEAEVETQKVNNDEGMATKGREG